MKRIISAVLCAVILLCAVACSSGSGNRASVRVLMDTKPTNIDPQLAESTEELAVTRNCFEGLFRYDSGHAVKAACSDYTVSDDGLIWEFTLRDGLKWSDSVPITADDFVFGIKRSLMPETVAKNAKLLNCITGAEAALNGTGSIENVGISAKDSKTVVITLNKKNNSLPEILSRAICMPCRKDVFDKAKGRYGMSDKLVVCNGPYTLAGIGDSTLRIVKNEHYTGDFNGKFNQVTFSYGATESERITSLSDSLADIAFISSGSADEANAAELEIQVFKNTSWILSINKNTEVLGDSSVSAAIKAAFDSSAYSDVLPYSFSAFGGIIADELQVNGQNFLSIAGTRAPLKASETAGSDFIAALEKQEGKLGALSLVYPEEYELKQTSARIAQYLQQQLGIVVNITPSSTAKLNADVKSGSYQMAILPVSSDDGYALTALANMVTAGLCDEFNTTDPLDAEQAILANPHIIPVAQSGRCVAFGSTAENVRFDLFEGVVCFY